MAKSAMERKKEKERTKTERAKRIEKKRKQVEKFPIFKAAKKGRK